MNKVILVGRLTRDPDVRYSAGENATVVTRYTLAVEIADLEDVKENKMQISLDVLRLERVQNLRKNIYVKE